MRRSHEGGMLKKQTQLLNVHLSLENKICCTFIAKHFSFEFSKLGKITGVNFGFHLLVVAFANHLVQNVMKPQNIGVWCEFLPVISVGTNNIHINKLLSK